MSAASEIYGLIERLLQLRDAEHTFRVRVDEMHREAHERMRRFAEEAQRVHDEFIATLKMLREKLGIPEPPESTVEPGKFDFGELFDAFFNPKKTAPASP